MTALRTLQASNTALSATQNRISTGLKVNDASDNASSWSVATHMRSDVSQLGQVSQNLGTADSIVGAALAGATAISTLVATIRSKITAEADPSNNSTSLQSDITSLVNQIQQVVSGSSYNGINILSGANGTMSFASTVVSDTAGMSQVSTIGVTPFSGVSAVTSASSSSATSISNLSTTGSGGLSVLQVLQTASVSTSNLQTQLQMVDSIANAVNSIASSLGSAKSNIEGQMTFVNSLSDTLTKGVSTLVDADMTAESARLSALQTQQQLGTQALSIANQAPQSLLRLFQ